jgi:hypothetical protein
MLNSIILIRGSHSGDGKVSVFLIFGVPLPPGKTPFAVEINNNKKL